MTETPALLMAAALGAGLGVIYFSGLWWTVRHAASFRRPALCVLVSALLRMGLALGGFYLAAGGSWQRMLLCLLGFVVVRAAVTWLTPLPAAPHPARLPEAPHAP